MGLTGGGAFAEKVVVHERLLVPIPEGMTFEQAAAVPEAFVTAHDALLTQGGLRPGQRVLIQAVASGVGTAAVQIVALVGAEAVGTAGSREKLQRVRRIAPFVGIDYRREDVRQAVEARFGPRSIHLVLDLVGGAQWERNLEMLAPKGTLVLVGLVGGSEARAPLATILRRRLRIVGTVLRARPLEEKAAAVQAFRRDLLGHLRSGRLQPVVDSVYSIDDIRDAIARMISRENVGKIVLRLR
jgi:NADPH:quinone reductase-like Zn-dependent oxidoreductase